MWLHLEESEDTKNDMVLTVQDGRTIVHHREYTDLAQQWSVDAEGHLHPFSGAATDVLLTNGLIGAGKAGDKQTWWFDSENHSITTDVEGLWTYTPNKNFKSTHKYLAVPKEKLMPGSEVRILMAREAEQMNHHWRIEYCDHWKA
jgi:hypothetical protein